MAQSSPLIVHIEARGKSLGIVMNDIRSWLDSHKMQLIDFRPDAAAPGAVAFDIRFAQEHEARLFEHAFAALSPEGSVT